MVITFLVAPKITLHSPSQTNCEAVTIKSLIKDRAEETCDSPQQILVVVYSTASDAASLNLPKLDHLRRTIRSQS